MLVAKNVFKTNFPDLITGSAQQLSSVIHQNTFPNLYKLLSVAFTLPISSATCERSFFAMRRVYTWLRTSMLQERFTNLAIIHIKRDLSNRYY